MVRLAIIEVCINLRTFLSYKTATLETSIDKTYTLAKRIYKTAKLEKPIDRTATLENHEDRKSALETLHKATLEKHMHITYTIEGLIRCFTSQNYSFFSSLMYNLFSLKIAGKNWENL